MFNRNSFRFFLFLFIFTIDTFFFISKLSAEGEVDHNKLLKEYKKKIIESKESLEALSRDIEYKTKRKEELQKKEELTSERLENSVKKIEKIENEIAVTNIQLKKIQKKYRSTQYEFQNVQLKELKLKEILKQELKFVYKRGIGNTSHWDFWTKEILLAGNAANFYKKYKELKILLKQKSEIFKKTLEVEDKILSLKKNLNEQRNETRGLLNKQEYKNKELQLVKKREKNLLEKIREEKVNYEKEIQKLKETEEEISKLIQIYTKKRIETEEAKKLSQKNIVLSTELNNPLVMPTIGTVVTKYGKQKHPEFDTYRIVNGIEISGKYGQDIIAVSDGRVLFCNIFKSYGKTVIIDHGGGYFTVYANLKDINVIENEKVQKGKIIGTMGYSFIGKEPRLYFELRKNGKPEDPLNWIKQ